MNILFTICGRAGSKGVKNKNFKMFLGFPLPFYTFSAIDLFRKQNKEHFCDVVLNTDSAELIKLFQKFVSGDFDIITRKVELGEDSTPKIAVVANCLEIMRQRKNIYYDVVVDLDITSPLRTVRDIQNLVEKKCSCSSADVIFSVTEARRNPYFNMVKKTREGVERVIQSNYNTRQDAPEIYDMNASLYAYSPDFLSSGKMIFEGKADMIEMLDTAVLDIDCEADFELMQVISQFLFLKYPEYGEVQCNISNL